MKSEKMAEALGEIDPTYIAQAAGVQKPKWARIIAAAAAILLVALLVQRLPITPGNIIASTNPTVQGTAPADLGRPVNIPSPNTLQLSNLVAAPQYPKMVTKPDYDAYSDKSAYYADEKTWLIDQCAQYNQPRGYADSLDRFFAQSIPQFLAGQTENAVYSPVNVYMALAMLAETAEGSSRQQILGLLELESIEALRTQVSHIWNAHYCADGATTTVLANSIWLDSNFAYKQAAIDTLADTYFASVFHGDLGTEEMNEQLRQWISSQTGGLLEKQTEGLEMDPRTVFALASTIYFSADWESSFSEKSTREAIFHANNVSIKTQFMNNYISGGTYYWGNGFGAVRLELSGENDMWLILPDEGKTVDDVLASGEYLQMCTGNWKNRKQYDIRLSLPKFDISSRTDLVEGMKQLGVTDIFHSVSDFSTLTDDSVVVNKIDHAVRVAVDEEGCIAAAYTVVHVYKGIPEAQNELDFILNRPFLFVITSRDQLPLFAGVVNQP